MLPLKNGDPCLLTALYMKANKLRGSFVLLLLLSWRNKTSALIDSAGRGPFFLILRKFHVKKFTRKFALQRREMVRDTSPILSRSPWRVFLFNEGPSCMRSSLARTLACCVHKHSRVVCQSKQGTWRARGPAGMLAAPRGDACVHRWYRGRVIIRRRKWKCLFQGVPTLQLASGFVRKDGQPSRPLRREWILICIVLRNGALHIFEMWTR